MNKILFWVFAGLIVAGLVLNAQKAFAGDAGGGDGGGDSGGASEAAPDKPWWFETQAVSNKNPHTFIGWYQKDNLKGPIGFFGSVIGAEDGYKAFYAGPTWQVYEGLVVGAAIGREIDREASGVRRAVFVDWTWRDFNTFALFENGATGPWNKITVTYSFNEKWGAGLMHQTSLGVGPRLEYNFKRSKTTVQVWAAVLKDKVPQEEGVSTAKEYTYVIGLNFAF